MYKRILWFSPIRPKDALIFIPSKLIEKKLLSVLHDDSAEELRLFFIPSMREKTDEYSGINFYKIIGDRNDANHDDDFFQSIVDQSSILTVDNVYPYYTEVHQKSTTGSNATTKVVQYSKPKNYIIKSFHRNEINWSICGSYYVVSMRQKTNTMIEIVAQILVNVCDMEQKIVIEDGMQGRTINIPFPVLLRESGQQKQRRHRGSFKKRHREKSTTATIPQYQFRLIHQKSPYGPHERAMVQYVNERMKEFSRIIESGNYDITKESASFSNDDNSYHSGSNNEEDEDNEDEGEDHHSAIKKRRKRFFNSVFRLSPILYGNDPIYKDTIRKIFKSSYNGIKIPPREEFERFTLVSLDHVSELVSFLFSILLLEEWEKMNPHHHRRRRKGTHHAQSESDGAESPLFTTWNDIRMCTLSAMNSFPSMSTKRNIASLFTQMTLEISSYSPVPFLTPGLHSYYRDNSYQEYRILVDLTDEIPKHKIENLHPIYDHGNYILQYRLKNLSRDFNEKNRDKHGKNTEWKCFAEYRLIGKNSESPLISQLLQNDNHGGDDNRIMHLPEVVDDGNGLFSRLLQQQQQRKSCLKLSRFSSGSLNIPSYSTTNVFTLYNDPRYFPYEFAKEGSKHHVDYLKAKNEGGEKQPTTINDVEGMDGYVRSISDFLSKCNVGNSIEEKMKSIWFIVSVIWRKPVNEMLEKRLSDIEDQLRNANGKSMVSWNEKEYPIRKFTEHISLFHKLFSSTREIQTIDTKSKLDKDFLKNENSETFLRSFFAPIKANTNDEVIVEKHEHHPHSTNDTMNAHEFTSIDNQFNSGLIYGYFSIALMKPRYWKTTYKKGQILDLNRHRNGGDQSAVITDLSRLYELIMFTNNLMDVGGGVYFKLNDTNNNESTSASDDLWIHLGLKTVPGSFRKNFSDGTWNTKVMNKQQIVEILHQRSKQSSVVYYFESLRPPSTEDQYQRQQSLDLYQRFFKSISKPVLELWNFSLIDYHKNELIEGIEIVKNRLVDPFYPPSFVSDKLLEEIQLLHNVSQSTIPRIQLKFLELSNKLIQITPQELTIETHPKFSLEIQNYCNEWNKVLKSIKKCVDRIDKMIPQLQNGDDNTYSEKEKGFFGNNDDEYHLLLGITEGVEFHPYSLNKRLYEFQLKNDSEFFPESKFSQTLDDRSGYFQKMIGFYKKHNQNIKKTIYDCFKTTDQSDEIISKWFEKLKKISFESFKCDIQSIKIIDNPHDDDDVSSSIFHRRISPYLSSLHQNILGEDHVLKNNLGSLEILFLNDGDEDDDDEKSDDGDQAQDAYPDIGFDDEDDTTTVDGDGVDPDQKEGPSLFLFRNRSLFEDSLLDTTPRKRNKKKNSSSQVIFSQKPYIQSNSTYYSPRWIRMSEENNHFLRFIEQYLKVNKREFDAEMKKLHRIIGKSSLNNPHPVRQEDQQEPPPPELSDLEINKDSGWFEQPSTATVYPNGKDDNSIFFRIHLSIIDIIKKNHQKLFVVDFRSAPTAAPSPSSSPNEEYVGGFATLIYSLMCFIRTSEETPFLESAGDSLSNHQKSRSALSNLLKSIVKNKNLEEFKDLLLSSINKSTTKYNHEFISLILEERLYKFLFFATGNTKFFGMQYPPRDERIIDLSPPRRKREESSKDSTTSLDDSQIFTLLSFKYPTVIFNNHDERNVVDITIDSESPSPFPLYIYNEDYALRLLKRQKKLFDKCKSLLVGVESNKRRTAAGLNPIHGDDVINDDTTLDKMRARWSENVFAGDNEYNLGMKIQEFKESIDKFLEFIFEGGMEEKTEDEISREFNLFERDYLSFIFNIFKRTLLTERHDDDDIKKLSSGKFMMRRFEYINSIINKFVELDLPSEPLALEDYRIKNDDDDDSEDEDTDNDESDMEEVDKNEEEERWWWEL